LQIIAGQTIDTAKITAKTTGRATGQADAAGEISVVVGWAGKQAGRVVEIVAGNTGSTECGGETGGADGVAGETLRGALVRSDWALRVAFALVEK
jgi:hypothetical protein